MNPFKGSPLNSTVVALALTSMALIVSLVVRPYIEQDIFILFYVAVWLSAWYHGPTGGLTATGGAALAILYFFLRPDPDATTPSWSVLTRLVIFVLSASLLTWLTAAWRDSRQLLSSTLSSIADAVLATDRDGRITFLNPVAETLTGWPREEARGKKAGEVLRLVDEKTHEPVENPFNRALQDRAVAALSGAALVSRTGAEVPIEHSASPVRDQGGRVLGAILVMRDISKRRQLEEQATHSQKMDAVGRLAGGVAGDFNNVLTVITGYAELLRAEVPSDGSMRRFIDEIIYAGERAAALTRHLLAFSKGSAAQPRVVDLNTVVSGMEPMLRRLLGQNIELILLQAPGLGRVKADPSQLEQVVLNLATNSRDAMPHGGKLVVETANVELENGDPKRAGATASGSIRISAGEPPGRGSYVMLAVSDTGKGMDAETRSRLFEPFFTTKAPGKGSGLGLATAYGIIKQSDGQVTVYSQPNCGTIFEIYLPRVNEPVTEPERKRSAKGSETILLVDDEEGVRKLVSAVLRSNGYEVLEAANGGQALASYEKNSHKIDMVLTDIVMPQMSGFELGKELTSRNQSLKILYMSGYRENAFGANGEAPRAFLHKPFTPDILLGKVREVLDSELV
ncbi:MAG TPA: ATP-binding protein [Bryobacteraceae bacterium]|nr:ATP-binding protein [Bryobacteraceae bacterium]